MIMNKLMTFKVFINKMVETINNVKYKAFKSLNKFLIQDYEIEEIIVRNQKRFFLVFLTLLIFGCTKKDNNDNNDNTLIKHPLAGLVTMGSTKDLRNGNYDVVKEANVHADIYSGVVIKATWGELEPQRGIYDFTSIKHQLSDIEDYNNLHPKNKLGAKLRVSAVINPPSWVLNLSSGSVEVVIDSSHSYEIALFWTKEYRQAWHELQVNLSNSFDNNLLIQEVCITSPSMITDEPFVTIFNQATIQNLHQKGFTDTAYIQALQNTILDYHCWKKTTIDFSFNMFRRIDTGVPINDIDFTINLMRIFKNEYGERAILSNHGLQETLSSGALPIYNEFQELGGAIAVQTKSPNDLSDNIFYTGLNYGVSEFEIWDSKDAEGYADFSINDLERWKKIINN